MPDYDQHVSTRLSWLICKEAIAPPQRNGSEFGLESSLRVFARLFSQKANAVYTLGEEEVGLLWNQPPRLWIKLRCGGSWGRGGGSRLPSTFRSAKVKHIRTLHIPSLTQIRFLSHQMPLHLRVALPQWTFNCKLPETGTACPSSMANTTCQRRSEISGEGLWFSATVTPLKSYFDCLLQVGKKY